MNTYNRYLNILLKKYLPSIAASAGRYISSFDWGNEYKIWEDQFKRYTDKFELDKLEKAFKRLLNQEEIKKMPTPGFIKGVIRDMSEPTCKPVPGRPKTNIRFMQVFAEWKALFKKDEKTEDEKKKIKELSNKMVAMTKGAR